MSGLTQPAIHAAVAEYYAATLAEHGPTARGVDWASPESQELRFATLLEDAPWTDSPTVLDYGCGYGVLSAYLDRLGVGCRYQGYDLVPGMVDAARTLHPHSEFTSSEDALAPADLVIASGIFNVKRDTPVADWERYVEQTLARLWSLTRRSLSFNLLPPASPAHLARPHLYYADPAATVGRCQQLIDGTVTLREDYGLWEYSVTISRKRT